MTIPETTVHASVAEVFRWGCRPDGRTWVQGREERRPVGCKKPAPESHGFPAKRGHAKLPGSFGVRLRTFALARSSFACNFARSWGPMRLSCAVV